MLYSGSYFYPPRTEARISYDDNVVLAQWRSYADVIAQYKINGQRNLIKVSPDRKIEFWNRHKERQKYVIPDHIKNYILHISAVGFWTVWDSELVHYKTKTIKNLVYIFDCLVWKSKHLIGMTYGDRYKLLPHNFASLDSIGAGNNVVVAQNYGSNDWNCMWTEAQKYDWCEGLVVKRTGSSSRLTYGGYPLNNSSFMCRVRKPGKNMPF